MKKILAFTLSLIMCLSVLPIDSVHAQKEVVEQEAEKDTVKSEDGSDILDNADHTGSSDVVDNTDMEDDNENIGSTEPAGNTGNISGTDNMDGTGVPEEDGEAEEDNDGQENTNDPDSNTADVEKKIFLNYVLVEKGYLEAGETQNVVVSLGDKENHVSKAVLEYRNDTNGQIYQTESIANSEEGLLFEISAQEQGIYTLISVSYTYEGQTECIILSEIGIDVQFGVGVAVDVEADDYLIDPSAVEVESNIVSVGEDGVVESDSIAEALEDAATYHVRNNRTGNLIVVLDPGHDSTHAGAQKYGYGEEKLVLKIAKYCKAELEQYSGVTVYMTREGEACANGGSSVNSATCNARRVEFAAAKGADVFVSFHLNSSTSSSAMGAGVYYPNSNYRPDLGQEGHDLGRLIVNNLVALGLHEWAGGTLIHNSEDGTTYPDGSLADYLAVIRRCKLEGIPAVLIEHAFLSNSSDVNNFLNSDEKLKRLGEADAKAIVDYYGLKKGEAFRFTKAELASSNVDIGNSAKMHYAVNKNATVTVDLYYGNNSFLKNIVSNQSIGTGEQVVSWDLRDRAGRYVKNGTYRFTVTAVTSEGEKITTHKWFQVSGSEILRFEWANLANETVNVGDTAGIYYALNMDAKVTVQIYYGNNSFLKTIVSNQAVGTEEQLVTWDLKDSAGKYVYNGTYRFTISATAADGQKTTTHKWFQVSGNEPLKFKWTNLGSQNVAIGNNAKLSYAINKKATVTVQIFYGNNNFLKTIVSNQTVGTDDQVANWDLKDNSGEYVSNGTYRFTITATTADGERITVHKWFQVSGNDPLAYKWTNMGSPNVKIGNDARFYYAVNKKAKVTVQLYYGNNSFMKTLVSNREIGTNDQVAVWDLKDNAGEYVLNGTYRFTITATTEKGEKVTAHKWFQVSGNDPLSYKWTNMGAGNVKIGNDAHFYYAVNKKAKVTVQLYYGNNSFMKTLVSNKEIGTNDQVAIWDLKDNAGEYVLNGTYRFTITATTEKGERVVAHKWFTVSGNDPLAYKWTNLGSASVEGGTSARLYYAVNKKANVTVQMYYGNNSFMKTLVSNRETGTNDQVAIWDLKDANGNYVQSGTYRFTVTATTSKGERVVAHKWFQVKNYSIMGASNTTVDKMVAFYNARYTYPKFYANSEAPTIRDFCQIYYEECAAEGVKAEVAFCQSMKETGYLQYPGATCVVKPEQYNFAGLDTTGAILPNGKVDVGRSYVGVRQGIRAHVQRLKAYAVKGTTPSSFAYPCIDDDKYTSAWWRSTIVGSAPYVEWLGKSQNPSGFGWATDPNYGYSILNDYMRKLLSY